MSDDVRKTTEEESEVTDKEVRVDDERGLLDGFKEALIHDVIAIMADSEIVKDFERRLRALEIAAEVDDIDQANTSP